MSAIKNKFRLVAVLLAIIGGIIPVAGYWFIIGRVPNITPEEAKIMLANPGENAVLVDVRPAEDYARDHIEAAQNWSYEQIAGIDSKKSLPRQFVEKRLLLICQSGILSAVAAGKLHDFPSLDVRNIQGGMQVWAASGEKPCPLGL